MYKEKTMTANGIDVLAGLWLILAPFVLGFAGTTLATSNIIVGIIITVLAIKTGWIGWVNGLLGLWTLIAPFALVMVTTASTWNNVIVGLIVVVASLWSASGAAQSHPKMG
jgi:hypothetical protein